MSDKKAIIFGVNGQDGHYLTRLLTDKEINVIGVSRSEGNWIKGDVTDRELVRKIIKKEQPDFIFHFAAQSSTRYEYWYENHRSISDGSFFILDAVKEHSAHSRVFIAGSGLQFLNQNKPIHESDPFHARDPYSVSRIHTVFLARYYRTLGLKVYNGYLFNHDSPLRTERHITQKIAKAAKRIAGGSAEKLPVGNIHTCKEWGFAGDIVEAIWTLIQQETHFEAVVGTGEGHSIEEWLNACFGLFGLDWTEYVQPIEGFKPEYQMLVSNPVTIKSLGWQPNTSFESLAKIMVS